MESLSKEKIIAMYRRLVAAHGGAPVGVAIFIREAGVSQHHWRGGYWRSWSAFQADAGYEPNKASEKIPDEVLLQRFAELAVELRAVPTDADLRLKRKDDPSFPFKAAFGRWGSREALIAKVVDFCETRDALADAIAALSRQASGNPDQKLEASGVKGFVYLLRSGKSYKLGRTSAVGRRLRELAIQLPQKPDTVHVIETDDPEGIEQYWHRRFAEKRQGGEWFVLTPEDVKAFKRRRFQ